MKKLALLAIPLFLASCGEAPRVDSDGEVHKISWPGGGCVGKVVKAYTYIEFHSSSTPVFVAKCADGETYYNLSNFKTE